MCGICGHWSDRGASMDLLQKMAAQVSHRGPDDEGFHIDGPIGLANRRLSIIDVSGGKQPISNEDGTIWVVFNGEIYNYPELREGLIERGHTFRTRSDTEVIAHLFEEYGPDCVRQLRGMFAVAVWDGRRQRLFLARDPLGQKPLYYAAGNYGFLFGSEIKSLLQHESVKPRLNVRALHSYISLRYMPGSDTLFSGIHKLAAGHYLLLDRGAVQIKQYWDLRYTPKLSGTEDEVTHSLKQQLIEAIRSHMLSDVPVGAFLSGGLDSSLVAAVMATYADTRIKTFSIGVRDQSFSELPYARMVAQRYGTEHHEFVVDPDLVALLPGMVWHMEEPVDPFAFGVYSVARLAAQHVKVVLGGDGGDEMFAGYDRYLGNQLVDLYCFLPRALRRHVIEPLVQRLPDDYSYNSRVQKLRWLVAMSETSAGERYAQSAAFLRFGQAHKERLYSRALWDELGGLDASAELLSFFDAENARHPVDKMLYTDVKTRLADHLLMITDRMTMAHSLEGRSPYVDQRLAEFAARIPVEFKLRGRRLRHIQREVAREFLPEALLRRPKQGFSFPLAHWFRNELRDIAERIFRDSSLVAAGYFQREAMVAFLDEHVSGRIDHNYRLWLLLNLELWHRMYCDGASITDLRALLSNSSEDGRIDPSYKATEELASPLSASGAA